MNIETFIISVASILAVHLTLSFIQCKLNKAFPFIFGGPEETSKALFTQSFGGK